MGRQESMTPEEFRAALGEFKGFKSQRKRHEPGVMNKTEQALAYELDLDMKAGKILWWKFESITLKLAHDTRLTVDFAILHTDGTLEFRDAKGHAEEDYLVKMRVAADTFWMFAFSHWTRKPNGGWEVKLFGRSY